MKLLPIFAIGACLAAGSVFADTLSNVVTRIVIDPTTPSILYAGDESSAATATYKSTDWGVTWTFMYPVTIVGDIAPDPLDTSTLYASGDSPTFGPDIIFKSTDGGVTWNTASAGIAGVNRVGSLAVDPFNEGVIYAATYGGGLYKSSDGGQNWTSSDGGIVSLTTEIYSPLQLIADPSHAGTLYFSLLASPGHHGIPPVTVPSGLYKSTDGGATWKTTGVTGVAAMDPSDSSHLVTCSGGTLKSSMDAGVTWSAGAACSGSVIAISSTDPRRILLASESSTTVQVSNDGGATLGTLYVFPTQIRSIAYRGGNIYVGTSGSGLYISRNDGATWSPSASATIPQTIHVPADQSTIQAAIDAAADGDTVLVAPGTYYEKLDFKGKAITVKSSGGAVSTILDGNNDGPIVSFHNGEGSASVLQGFTLTHALLTDSSGFTAVAMTDSSPTIEDDVFVDNVDSVGLGTGSSIFGNFSSAVIIRNHFVDNMGVGSETSFDIVVSLSGGSPMVADNVFVNNSALALYDQTLPAGGAPQIYNNTMVGNTTALEVLVDADAPGMLFSNNLMAFNHGVGFAMLVSDGVTQPPIHDNLVYGNATSDYYGIASQTGVDGNISADPMLKDRVAGDVHLLYGSPAIDAGDSGLSQISSTDFYGNTRLYAGIPDDPATVDIGAAEWVNIGAAATDGSVAARPDTPVSGALTATAAYAGQALTFVIVSQPAHGTMIVNSSTGQFKYTPAAGYTGPDSFTFKVTDALGTDSNIATENVTVADVAPMATPLLIMTASNRLYSGYLKAKAAYAGQVLTYSVVKLPSHGVVSITDSSTGAFTYIPARHYMGRDSFTFSVTDQWGKISNTATVFIAVH